SADGDEVTVETVTSSEADSGLGGGDEPNDIVVLDSDSLLLRAERFSRDGRTYTIEAVVRGDGQVRYDSTEVIVPHDRGRDNRWRRCIDASSLNPYGYGAH